MKVIKHAGGLETPIKLAHLMQGFTTECDSGFNFGGHAISARAIVLKTRLSVIFVNLRPFKPNHLLVSPTSPHKRFHSLSSEECVDLFECVRLTLLALGNTYDGYSIGIQDGEHAGQTVSHVHVHIVPRGQTSQSRFTFDAERRNRTLESMQEEADYLKPILGGIFRKYYSKGWTDSSTR